MTPVFMACPSVHGALIVVTVVLVLRELWREYLSNESPLQHPLLLSVYHFLQPANFLTLTSVLAFTYLIFLISPVFIDIYFD